MSGPRYDMTTKGELRETVHQAQEEIVRLRAAMRIAMDLLALEQPIEAYDYLKAVLG